MKKLNAHEIKGLTKQELLNVLEDEVFSDNDFKRHINETAIKENVSYDLAETVIKNYIISIGSEMIKIKKHRRRIVVFGFLNIDIIEPKFNKYSIYFKKRKT